MTKNSIKLIILDVDGVLTDGSLFIGSDENEYKRFNTQDGMGIALGHFSGLQTAIITGRKSQAVTKRAKELKIQYVYQGVSDKLQVLNDLLSALNIKHSEVCYMGDDINDLPVINLVGLSFAPSNAVSLVKEQVNYVTKSCGGQGAVREMIDLILKDQFDYNELVNQYIYGGNPVIQ